MRVGSKKSGSVKGSTKARSPKNTSNKSSTKSEIIGSLGELTSALTSDRVELSDQSAVVDVVRKIVNSASDVRTHEVERIRQLLNSGQYQIHHEKIAEAFIKEVIMSEIARRMRKRPI